MLLLLMCLSVLVMFSVWVIGSLLLLTVAVNALVKFLSNSTQSKISSKLKDLEARIGGNNE